MKTSNILIVLFLFLTVACGSKELASDNGQANETEDHSHDPATGGHSHEEGEVAQEEFVLSDELETPESNGENGNKSSDAVLSNQEDQVTIKVPANKGVEYKFHMKQYEKLTYEWTSDAPLYFDFHGEPMDYETSKYFESFTKTTSDNVKGVMTTPFEGSHGWYWKNNSDKEVSVTLKTKGNYRITGLKK
tara:strand:+ start:35722 stop:36291 length:570 start_codon:yes stop_codon:yes gene_type:complete